MLNIQHRFSWLLIGILWNLHSVALAKEYQVDYLQSQIQFSGTHAGMAFSGLFKKWQAEIQFNPDDLSSSSIIATIDVSTATTGNDLYDGTLVEADWFDSNNLNESKFVSQNMTALGSDTYEVFGQLTLKSTTAPVSFIFIYQPTGETISTATTLKLDRMQFDIGKAPDPEAEWVSREIDLHIKIIAQSR